MEDRLTRIHAVLGEGYALKAYGLAVDSKREILAEREIDARLLGWLRYYEFKCLYKLEAWAEAVDLFRHPEPAPFHVH